MVRPRAQAAHGRSFGAQAGVYDEVRPGYPDSALDLALTGWEPQWSGLRVCDLGAGTGILSRRLLTRGADLIAVDPDTAALERNPAPTKIGTMGMKVNFIEMAEERSHPNTAIINMRDADKEISVEGVSIGGGKIEVVAINGFNIAISGNYPALLVFHKDTFGTIGRVANILGDSSINVGSMQVSRKEKGDQALMTCELDESVTDEIIDKIKNVEGVVTVSLMGDA